MGKTKSKVVATVATAKAAAKKNTEKNTEKTNEKALEKTKVKTKDNKLKTAIKLSNDKKTITAKKSSALKKTTQKIKAITKNISKALSKPLSDISKKTPIKNSSIDESSEKLAKNKIQENHRGQVHPAKRSPLIKPLTEEQLALCKKKLLEMRNTIFYKDYAIKEFTIDKNELSDVLDEATINDLMSKEVRLRNREIFHLKKINKGLEMIQRGTYGVCHDCDEHIPFERLIVRPETDMCISCKEASESEELRNINDKLPKSQGLSMEQVLGR